MWKKNLFHLRKDNEEVFDPEVSYLNATGALIYLTNYTRSDISFATNLLERFSSSLTQRHWNKIKHVFRYLRETTNSDLFYFRWSKKEMIGYVGVVYLSDPHKGRYQTWYVFTCGGTMISWRSQK